MTEQDQFHRARHLLFAAVALLVIGVADRARTRPLDLLGISGPWEPPDVLLWRMLPLVGVALVAWLAFERFDTRSGVELVGRGWWKLGWEPWLLFVMLVGSHVSWPLWVDVGQDELEQLAHEVVLHCHDPYTGVAWGWLIAAIFAGAVTEEIVFRGLLQPALAGYIRDWPAVFAQALLFNLTHFVVYQQPFTTVHMVSGVIYGFAMLRTRSLLMPILLHASSNLSIALALAPALE